MKLLVALLFLTFVVSEPNVTIPKFPWSENVPRLQFTTQVPIVDRNLTRTALIEEVKKGHIPDEIKPFLNMSMVEELRRQNNNSLDFIITDEDVADIEDDMINKAVFDGQNTHIKMTEAAGSQLYQHWVEQAFSGLMGAIVTNRINNRKLSKKDRKQHFYCTQNAKDVVAHAKCVSTILVKVKERKERLRKYSNTNSYLLRKRDKGGWDSKRSLFLNDYQKFSQSGIEGFRVKRSILQPQRDKFQVKRRSKYELIDEKNLSPVSLIARRLTEIVHSVKNKPDKPKGWQQVLSDIKSESKRIRKKQSTKEKFKNRFSKVSHFMSQAGMDPKKAFKAMDMEDLFEDDPILSEREERKRAWKEKEKHLTTEEKMMAEPLKLIREGLKIGMVMAGKNVSDFDDKNINVFSPQFMNILPNEYGNDTLNFFSPSILAMHGEGTEEERALSLNRALKILSETGQEEWLNFVFEASGVTEAVDKIRDAEKKEEMEEMRRDYVGKDGQQLYFDRKNFTDMYGEKEAEKLDFFEGLYKSLHADQMEELNRTGYAVLNKTQLEYFYGESSPFNDSASLEKFKNLSHDDIHRTLESNIKLVAEGSLDFKYSRRKDIVLTPLVLASVVLDPVIVSQPIILSPVVLTPLILSPAVFGAIVLSPWLFVPVVLSPRVLGAVILTPVAFVPIILTPLALHPLVLAPGVGLPLILSPFVLNPFILSPTVLTPLILSPFCLSPFIGVPNALTPLILSPFVLSPLILSPPYVSAFVLTPYLLSPIVASNGAVFTAVLSPGILS